MDRALLPTCNGLNGSIPGPVIERFVGCSLGRVVAVIKAIRDEANGNRHSIVDCESETPSRGLSLCDAYHGKLEPCTMCSMGSCHMQYVLSCNHVIRSDTLRVWYTIGEHRPEWTVLRHRLLTETEYT